MKEKLKIGKLTKGLLLIMQQALVILCAVSMTLFVLNVANPMTNVVDFEGELRYTYNYCDYDSVVSVFYPKDRFEDTWGFSNLMRQTTSDVIRYCVIREQLEIDGRFDGQKGIDIKQYANHLNELMPTWDTSVTYYLQDLISWSQYGLTMEEVYPEMFSAARELLQENADNIEKIYSIEAEEKTYIIEAEIADSFLAEGPLYGPVERYLPVDSIPLLLHAGSVEEYEQYVDYLQTTIDMIGVNYAQYQDYRKYFDEQDLSMKYYITVGEGSAERVYTNLKEGFQTDAIKDMEYLYYEPTSSTFQSNIADLDAKDIKSIWQTYTYAFSEPCRIWIVVDTSYPYPDDYSKLSSVYAECVAENALLAKTAVIAACAVVVLLVLLTVFAGRKKDTQGVALLRFDRIGTEFVFVLLAAAAAAALLSLVPIIDTVEALDRQTLVWEERIFACAAVGVWTLVFDSIALFLYLSLIRRLKAHTILTNSLIVRFCKRIIKETADIYTNMHLALRVIIPALAVCLLNLLLGGIGMSLLNGRAEPAGLLLLVLTVSGDAVIGVLLFHEAKKRQSIVDGINRIKSGDLTYKVDTTGLYGENLKLAAAVNSIGGGIQTAVEISTKDERMKTDLITNVSHDIKTPLTSIISYVDLLKRENIQDDTIKGYIDVLDMKSQRLKQLTEDLVEASKISSGNITYDMKELNLVELLQQTAGEYEEKFRAKNISLVMNLAERPVKILADSRRMWRIIENLYGNICKYALEGTRAYVDVRQTESAEGSTAVITIKNISEQPLNIAADELTERFIRGDISRSSEGSGLGLSIAKNLVEAQKGTFTIYLDGDLFKVTMRFPAAAAQQSV